MRLDPRPRREWVSRGRPSPLGRVLADYDCVEHGDDFIGRDLRTLGMFTDRGDLGGLVDANRADTSVRLLDDIRADPADTVRHLFVADFRGARGPAFKVGNVSKCAAAADDI